MNKKLKNKKREKKTYVHPGVVVWVACCKLQAACSHAGQYGDSRIEVNALRMSACGRERTLGQYYF